MVSFVEDWYPNFLDSLLSGSSWISIPFGVLFGRRNLGIENYNPLMLGRVSSTGVPGAAPVTKMKKNLNL